MEPLFPESTQRAHQIGNGVTGESRESALVPVFHREMKHWYQVPASHPNPLPTSRRAGQVVTCNLNIGIFL